MIDRDVGRKTVEGVLHRKLERRGFIQLLERRLHRLHQTVRGSADHRMLPGVEELPPKPIEDGSLFGIDQLRDAGADCVNASPVDRLPR